ncbi:hypothetical protein [Caballeronia calidae]|uniref:hypothetical protein n=1 Tax=Caballeronia calidae TaxID=1777139 RepID=UPI0012FD47D5|nr:hypothetical protein [Caballeronia calidae]
MNDAVKESGLYADTSMTARWTHLVRELSWPDPPLMILENKNSAMPDFALADRLALLHHDIEESLHGSQYTDRAGRARCAHGPSRGGA